GAVRRVGGVNREILVTLDPDRLLSLGLSAADVSRRISAMQREASGGRVKLGDGEQTVRTRIAAPSAQALAEIQIPLPGGRVIRLDQVAEIEDASSEQRSAAFLDGKPVVGFE